MSWLHFWSDSGHIFGLAQQARRVMCSAAVFLNLVYLILTYLIFNDF